MAVPVTRGSVSTGYGELASCSFLLDPYFHFGNCPLCKDSWIRSIAPGFVRVGFRFPRESTRILKTYPSLEKGALRCWARYTDSGDIGEEIPPVLSAIHRLEDGGRINIARSVSTIDNGRKQALLPGYEGMGQAARDLDGRRSIGSQVFESEFPILDRALNRHLSGKKVSGWASVGDNKE